MFEKAFSLYFMKMTHFSGWKRHLCIIHHIVGEANLEYQLTSTVPLAEPKRLKPSLTHMVFV